MSKFQIFTDSSSDLTTELRKQNKIEYFRMGIVVAGEQHHADLDWEEYSPEQLYAWVANTKNHCKTNLIPADEIETKVTEAYEKGNDVLYIGCSGKLTGSMNVFRLVTDELKEKYPARRAVGVDSCNACMGLGMIVLAAAKLQQEGKSLDEVVEWVEANKNRFNQCATVSTLSYLKEAGRVSAGSAFFGNIIGVKPIFISDAVGHNYVVEKVKGTKASLDKVFEMTRDRIQKEECDTVYLGQGMAQQQAALLKERLEKELGVKVVEFWIGPIIGITCGPGVFVTYCFGKEVTVVGPDA